MSDCPAVVVGMRLSIPDGTWRVSVSTLFSDTCGLRPVRKRHCTGDTAYPFLRLPCLASIDAQRLTQERPYQKLGKDRYRNTLWLCVQQSLTLERQCYPTNKGSRRKACPGRLFIAKELAEIGGREFN